MCRHITKEEQLEGWRALGSLVSGPLVGLRPIWAGVLAAVMARAGRKALPGRGTPDAIS